jgi:Acyclic terpene utilisation family protein AtuA
MNSSSKSVRIGNAQAFWGDRNDAAAHMLAREPELDYLTLDYLAEVSMSILAMQRERDPAAGFAREFVEVVHSLAPYWAAGGKCRVITNAGGLNPRGCAEACRDAIEQAGCRALKIAVVSGDDILEIVRLAEKNSASSDFRNLDTSEPLSKVYDRLVTANAYLGAAPIVEALAKGADIVITGRVADPSLTLGPAIHHFGWNESDLDQLAGATVAGHLIECGTQVTGGISTDWLDVPDAAHIGFPIVEIAADGSCIVTKPRGTGGRVTDMTVKEQLLYEIGDPANYLSPDVAVSFLTLRVDDLGDNRVRVSGAKGKPRPEKLKVSATYRDGYRSAGTLTIIGRDAATKSQRVGELVLERVRGSGYSVRDSMIECLGTGDATVIGAQNKEQHADGFGETVLRIAIETDSREAAECFSLELMPFITAGPQGTTGYAEGRPRVHPVFRYWPCLIERDAVAPTVEVFSSSAASKAPSPKTPCKSPAGTSTAKNSSPKPLNNPPTHLYDIAIARSGDKGTSATIGVIARTPNDWKRLQTWLTADRVAEFFAPLQIESVDRYELPNLGALNFVVHGVLRRSLRTDAQGKALGQILLEMQLPKT